MKDSSSSPTSCNYPNASNNGYGYRLPSSPPLLLPESGSSAFIRKPAVIPYMLLPMLYPTTTTTTTTSTTSSTEKALGIIDKALEVLGGDGDSDERNNNNCSFFLSTTTRNERQ